MSAASDHLAVALEALEWFKTSEVRCRLLPPGRSAVV